MKQKLACICLILTPFLLTACGKTEAPNTQSESQVAEISKEQQAAIDAIDQPVLDENNTDVPKAVAEAAPKAD
jgi:uncharacterized protein YcfL